MAGILDSSPQGILSQFQNTSGGAALGNPMLTYYANQRVQGLMRPPSQSENQFFQSSPQVGGYASPDNRVVMNPYSNLTPHEKAAVSRNENLRVFLRQNPQLAPQFGLTQEQVSGLQNTSYGNAPPEVQKETIAGRLYSGDPSAGKPTPEQTSYVQQLAKLLMEAK